MGQNTNSNTNTRPRLRPRGTARAYSAGFLGTRSNPDFTGDSTWTPSGYGFVKNVYSPNIGGSDNLSQWFAIKGPKGMEKYGRIITNYQDPEKSDTSYVDNSGLQLPKHATMFNRQTHSQELMDFIDRGLQGNDPEALNMVEARILNRKP